MASYILADKKDRRSASFLAHRPSVSLQPNHGGNPDDASQYSRTEDIEEVSEPPSSDTETASVEDVGPSMLTNMLRRSPPETYPSSASTSDDMHNDGMRTHESLGTAASHLEPVRSSRHGSEDNLETTPLLRHKSHRSLLPSDSEDLENQKPRSRRKHAHWPRRGEAGESIRKLGAAMNPKTWNKRTVWDKAVMGPIRCLPAVIVGLLLNVLDALSYGGWLPHTRYFLSTNESLGMILFPLGNPIFASLGPAGISIFYVSTIIAQLTFSCGSIFRGGVGSELVSISVHRDNYHTDYIQIEVVPFFHSMAAKITIAVGEDKPDAVIATTITSFALSSMLTGVVFYLMGRFRLGYIIGFIPRHILIGCIGGVGWFLVATGLEVSARLGEFHYDLETARRLFETDTLPLWLIPLALALLLFGLQRKITSRYFLPAYILCIPFVFYFIVLSLDSLSPDKLRQTGWIFEAPEAGQPWWYFWTLYSKAKHINFHCNLY